MADTLKYTDSDNCYNFPLGNNSSVSNGLHISASIGNGTPIRFMVDTGSTGIVIAKKFLANSTYKLVKDKFFELEYTSSGNLYWGQWIKAEVTLSSGNVKATTQLMNIRMVTKWRKGFNGPIIRDETKIGVTMMGVGFDRDTGPGTTDVGGNIVLSDINPFLLLKEMTPEGGMVPGYILTPTCITLGITKKNSKDFELVQLAKPPPSPTIPQDWQAPMVNVSVPTSKVKPFLASLLIDTGLSYSIVQAPLGIAPRMDTIMVVNPAGTTTTCRTQVAAGERVTLTITGLSKPVHDYIVGGKGDVPPKYVSWRHNLHNGVPFINASIHPLSRLDYMFDQREGRLGFCFRPRQEEVERSTAALEFGT